MRHGSVFFLAVLIFMPLVAHAAALTFVSDLISTSAPNTNAHHTIQFVTTQAIPASGKILITPEASSFVIPTGLDFTDVDLMVATSSSYTDRTLASAPSSTADGVAVVSGGAGSLTITLNSAQGIGAGERVRVNIGTNAVFGATGTVSIKNPSSVGSYRVAIATRTATNVPLDGQSAMIAVVSPVTAGLIPESVPPFRFSGLPSGTVSAGNSLIEISLETDELATCRFATTTGVVYSSMTGIFSPSAAKTFYAVVGGHQNSTSYNYFVRCVDLEGSANSDDYPIAFSLAATPVSNTSEGTGLGSDGTGGVGNFPNGSSVLYLASVTFMGLAAPNSRMYVLADGKPATNVSTKADGNFQATISGLERGTYTFQIYVIDPDGRTSSSFGSTMTLGSGTNNALSNIIVPPTIELAKTSVEAGEAIAVLGKSTPGGTVELTAQKQSGSVALADTHVYTTTAAKNVPEVPEGSWQILIPGGELSQGTYIIRARTVLSELSKSERSKVIYLGIGEEPSPNLFLRADLNKDDKINLVDFSILLSFWNTDNGDADINLDGIVNLADVSIMLFNWTG